MTNTDPNVATSLLARALRDRAADVGGEDGFYHQILAATSAIPQRRGFVPWPGVFGRRTGLLLVAALVGAGLVVAIVAGAFGPDRRKSPVTNLATPVFDNGPILVTDSGRSWWIDARTGAQLTGPGFPDLPRGVQDASFSRDGRRLAIVIDGDLELVDTSSGARSVVARCADIGWTCTLDVERQFSIDWSPTGTSIVVARSPGLLEVDVRDGTITPINPSDNGLITSPSWSPDGGWIVFEYVFPSRDGTDVSLRRWISIIRPDGSDRRRLSPPTASNSIGAGIPAWSPDGTRILYLTSDAWKETGDRATDGWTLSVTALDVSAGQALGGPAKLIDLLTYDCVGFCPTFTLAPDGSSVLIDTGDELVIARLDGNGRIGLGVNARVLAWRPMP